MPLFDRAVNVLATLDSELKQELPLIFICHSYGGLLVKQMLRTTSELTPEYKKIGDRTAGIVFLSTPHNGASIASYINAVAHVATSDAIRELKDNASTLRELSLWFRNKYDGNNTLMMKVFFESLNTYGIRVVDEISANPFIRGLNPISIDADHIDICKPPKMDVRVSQTLALINQIVSQQLDVGPDEKLSPLARIIKAKDDEIPLLREQLENELEQNPRDARIRAALRHMKALQLDHAVLECRASPMRSRLLYAPSILLVIVLSLTMSVGWQYFAGIYRFLVQLIKKIF
jgi:hypothetical protein